MTLLEMTNRVAAAAPFYIRDDTPAQLLLEAIDRLEDCENTPRSDVEVEGSAREIVGILGALYDRADQAFSDGNPGPVCPVSFVGQRPRLRGPADPSSTPGGRKRTRPSGDDDDDDDVDDDGSPNAARNKRRKAKKTKAAKPAGTGSRRSTRNNP